MALLVVSFPQFWTVAEPFLLYAIGITAYCLFVLSFYKHIGRRLLFAYKDRAFSSAKRQGWLKFWWKVGYAFKFLLFSPFLLFGFSAVLTLLIFLFTGELPLDTLLLIGMATLASIRVVAYINEELAQMFVQNFSFSLLVVFLITPSVVSLPLLFEKLQEVPSHFSTYLAYFTLIVVIEFALRLVDAVVKRE